MTSAAIRLQATGTLLMENDRAIVWRYDFDPGAETGWHVHGHEYIITTLTDCSFRLELADGEAREAFVPAGSAYSRPKGTEHNVINASDQPMSFIEVELKD